MRYAKSLVAGALALPLVATTARADEKNEPEQTAAHQKVTMDELPAAVKTTVDRESKGKTVEWMSKEKRLGQTVYDVEVVANGEGQVIEISDTGKVLDRKAKHDEKNEAEHSGK